MTLDELILMLQEIRKTVGGDVKVVREDDLEFNTVNVLDKKRIELC